MKPEKNAEEGFRTLQNNSDYKSLLHKVYPTQCASVNFEKKIEEKNEHITDRF